MIVSPEDGGYLQTAEGISKRVHVGAQSEVLRRLQLAADAALLLADRLDQLESSFAGMQRSLRFEYAVDSDLTVEIPPPPPPGEADFEGSEYDIISRVMIHAPGLDPDQLDELDRTTDNSWRGPNWRVALDHFTAEALGLPLSVPFTVSVRYQPVLMVVDGRQMPVVIGRVFERPIEQKFLEARWSTGPSVAELDLDPRLVLVAPGRVRATEPGSIPIRAFRYTLPLRRASRAERSPFRTFYWFESDSQVRVPDADLAPGLAEAHVACTTLLALEESAMALEEGRTDVRPSFRMGGDQVHILKSSRAFGRTTIPVNRALFRVAARFGVEPGSPGESIDVTDRLEYSSSQPTVARAQGSYLVAGEVGQCRVAARVPAAYRGESVALDQLETGFDVNVFGFAVREQYTVEAGKAVTLDVRSQGTIPGLAVVTLDWDSMNQGEFLGQPDQPPVTRVHGLLASEPSVEWQAPVGPGVYPIDLRITLPTARGETVLRYQIRVHVVDPRSRDDQLKFRSVSQWRRPILETEVQAEVRPGEGVRMRGWVYVAEERTAWASPSLVPVSSAGGFLPGLPAMVGTTSGSRIEAVGDAGEFLREAWVRWEVDPAFGTLDRTETGFVRGDDGRWVTLNGLRVRADRDLAGESFPVRAVLMGEPPGQRPPPVARKTVVLGPGESADLDSGSGGLPDLTLRDESGRVLLSAVNGIVSVAPGATTLPTSGYVASIELTDRSAYAVRTDGDRYVRLVASRGGTDGQWTFQAVLRLDGSNLLP